MSVQLERFIEDMFFKHRLQFPVHWAMIGVNGAFLTGRFELSIVQEGLSTQSSFKSTVLSGDPKNLRFPINMIFVDINGAAVHTSVENPNGSIDLTNLQKGQP